MRELVRQFIKFAEVGIASFMIDYAVLMMLSQVLGLNAVLSAGISYALSVAFNYAVSMRVVFTHRDDLPRRREFLLFMALSAVGLALNELLMAVGVWLLGSGPVMVSVAKVLATMMVTVWNFFSRHHWLDAGGAHGSGRPRHTRRERRLRVNALLYLRGGHAFGGARVSRRDPGVRVGRVMRARRPRGARPYKGMGRRP